MGELKELNRRLGKALGWSVDCLLQDFAESGSGSSSGGATTAMVDGVVKERQMRTFLIRISMAIHVYLHSSARDESGGEDAGCGFGELDNEEGRGDGEEIVGEDKAKRPSQRAIASGIGNSRVNNNLNHRLKKGLISISLKVLKMTHIPQI